MGKEAWIEALHQAGYPVDLKRLSPCLRSGILLQQIVADNELGALLKALEGEYVILVLAATHS